MHKFPSAYMGAYCVATCMACSAAISLSTSVSPLSCAPASSMRVYPVLLSDQSCLIQYACRTAWPEKNAAMNHGLGENA